MGKTPANTDVQFWRDPDLPGVEVRYSAYREDAFREHTHRAYSIGFLESGRTVFSLEGEPHAAQGGADGLHRGRRWPTPATRTATRTWPTACFTWPRPGFRPWPGRCSAARWDAVVFPCPVADDPALLDHWRSLHEAIMDGADRLEKESLLVQGLADVITRYAALGRPPRNPASNEPAVRRAKAHLAANLSRQGQPGRAVRGGPTCPATTCCGFSRTRSACRPTPTRTSCAWTWASGSSPKASPSARPPWRPGSRTSPTSPACSSATPGPRPGSTRTPTGPRPQFHTIPRLRRSAGCS